LRSINRSTHSLVLVSSETNPPIVKLVNLEEERIKLREAEAKDKLRRKAAAEEKEIQISWASADGDIAHKIDLARSIVEKGDRVQLVFAPRSGGGQAAEVSKSRKDELVSLFEEKLGEVGTKWRDDERTKSTLLEYWQATEEVRVEKKQKLTEKEMEKRKEKDEKKEARRRKEEERRRKAGLE
jgi:translation initiation factor IF-3